MANEAVVLEQPDKLTAAIQRVETGASAAPDESKPAPPTGEPPAEGQQPAEGQPPAEEKPPSEETQPETEQPDIEEAQSAELTKYKDVFKTHPELRAVVARHNALTELFPRFSEARQLREWFPTMEEAESVVNSAENAREYGRVFRENPTEFLDSLRESDERAYRSVISKIPQVLRETDEGEFVNQARYYTNHAMSNLYAWAQQHGNQEITAALQTLASMGAVQIGAPAAESRGNSEVERLKQQLAERDKADLSSQAQNFWNSVDQTFQETSVQAMETKLKEMFPRAKPADYEDMLSQAWQKLNERLDSQPQVRWKMAEIRRMAYEKGKTGESDFQEASNFLIQRSKATIPGVLKEISDRWAGRFMTQAPPPQKQEPQRTQTPQQQQQRSVVPAQNGQQRKRLSDEEIVRQLENRTYIRPAQR